MFNKGKNKISIIEIDTLIGNSTSIEGNLTSEKDIRIDGIFKGNINSQSKVIIGERASVIGDIYAYNIIIYGVVEGNIKGEGLLEIMESGVLRGDIEVKRMAIREGGLFCGKSNMIEEERYT